MGVFHSYWDAQSIIRSLGSEFSLLSYSNVKANTFMVFKGLTKNPKSISSRNNLKQEDTNIERIDWFVKTIWCYPPSAKDILTYIYI